MLRRIVLDSLAATIARPLVIKHRDRSLLAPIERASFVGSVPKVELVLEIGPFDRPSLSGPTIRYFDILPQNELKARAAMEARRRPEGCPFIHFVSPTGDLSIVEGEFSAIFSSHCIEHQPDLIRHLRQVRRLLRPGGSYYLIVPDKRFCFDHFLPESTVDEVRAAQGRTLHSEEAVAKHLRGTTHNIPALHWLGLHGRPSTDTSAKDRNADALRRARAGEYVDVHAWQFTPSSFRQTIRTLYDSGEIDMELTNVYDTGLGKLEFMAVLTREPN